MSFEKNPSQIHFLTRLSEFVQFTGKYGLFCFEIIRQPKRIYKGFPQTLHQFKIIGLKSIPLVIITGLATGSVMALQFGYGLKKFGGTLYIPKIVSLSILREMGPVFTSLLLAARVGSGIASEVSAMKVSQQLDAVRALGTDPYEKIILPKIFACLIAFPVMTLFANYIGLFGAMLISESELNISSGFFISKCLETLKIADLIGGLIKSTIFGFFVGSYSTFLGTQTKGGTLEVGKTTTTAVVVSSVFIMLSDVILTKLFIYVLYPR